MTTVRIKPTPLSESNGSMGHHTEAPRIRSRSDGSFGAHVESAPITMTTVVNGARVILPPSESEPK